MKLPAYPRYKPSSVEWLGDVPEHWEKYRIKHTTYVKGRIGWQGLRFDEFIDEGPYLVTGTDFVDGSINWNTCYHITPERYREDPYIQLRNDDLLITKDGTIGKVAVVKEMPGPTSLNSGVFVTRATRRVYSTDYMYWLLNSNVFSAFIDSQKSGTTIAHLYQNVFVEFCYPTPPLVEQEAISAFLARETGLVDRLVAKKRKLIERLKEKRAALISRTVTRGLLTAATRAVNLPESTSLKYSGLDWIGEIPTHWRVLPFTKYVAEKSDYRGKTPDKQPDGVFLVTARNVRMGFIDYDSSQEFISEEDYDEVMRRGLPKKGDVLFTTEAPLGNIALVDREGIALAQRIIRFRMSPAHYDSKFTLFAMMSDHFQVQLKSLSTGSTAEGLKASKLPLLRLIAPPFAEQIAIAAYLDAETAKLDALVQKVEEALERLQEYRTALITAAVTGKIDVRKAAA